jgi:hypothetical protein
MRSLIILLTAAISSCFAQGSPDIIATWTQMGASSNVLARAVVSGSSCPTITLNGPNRWEFAQPIPRRSRDVVRNRDSGRHWFGVHPRTTTGPSQSEPGSVRFVG